MGSNLSYHKLDLRQTHKLETVGAINNEENVPGFSQRRLLKILERLHNTFQKVPDQMSSMMYSQIMRPSTPPLEIGKSLHMNCAVFVILFLKLKYFPYSLQKKEEVVLPMLVNPTIGNLVNTKRFWWVCTASTEFIQGRRDCSLAFGSDCAAV